jgi:hypothetical protein
LAFDGQPATKSEQTTSGQTRKFLTSTYGFAASATASKRLFGNRRPVKFSRTFA